VTISEEIVRQEVAELHRFIALLVQMCAELRADYPVFDKTSREFFKHIGGLGLKSLSYLQSFPDSMLQEQYPEIANSERQKLLQLKSDWESLHQYIRPALDADTLHLPTPLIAVLHDRLHETEEWSSYRFTLFHAAEVNYFEVPSAIVPRVADGIASQVGATSFPKFLGFIGIPYSQADGLFLNCSLAHEMGHFIFQEDVYRYVEEKIDDALDRMVRDIGKTLRDEEVTLCRDLISGWTEETFCDLFAICLIGPAFSFAFSQLVAASMLIGRPEGEPDVFYRFEQDHPADVARFHSHQKLLDKLGWWQEIQNWSSAPAKVLKSCVKRASLFTIEIDNQLPESVTQGRLLQCYDDLCDWLIDYVPSRVKGHDDDVADFKRQSPIIAEYLRRAIVPSTIILEGEVEHPRPVVLINAGYQFLLEKLSLLLENIDGEKPDSIQSRSRLSARLELWLLKALEDHRLLTKRGS
jgi:hypothetical protein